MEMCRKIGVPHGVSALAGKKNILWLAGKYIFLAGQSIVGDGLKRLENVVVSEFFG